MPLNLPINRRRALQISLAAAAWPATTRAQTAPQGALRIVVPYPPGSSPDALARLLAETLAKQTGQTVLVENKPGAGGMIGAKAVSESAPDGLTLLMYTPAWSAQKIFVKKPAVAVPDGLEPVTIVAEGRFAFTANVALPARNIEELVNHAKAHPGKLNFATTGTGDALLYFHTLQQERGTRIETIQYKGSSEYLPALLANDVQLAFTPEFSVQPLVREGKLKVLAVTGDTRSAAFPDVQTFAEQGLPKIRNNWLGLLAPRGTPTALVTRLNADLVSVVKAPEVARRIRALYFEPIGSSPEAFRQRVKTEIDEWTALARNVGIEPQ